jgi:hypothetical protein
MDLARAFSELKSLPDTALQKELAAPSGAIPGFMVLGELHERKTMRAGAGKAPDETIKRKSMAEEYMGNIKEMMPMNMMQGMAPTPSQQTMPPQAMPPQGYVPPQSGQPGGIAGLPPPQQGYASGGVVGLARGGQVGGIEAYIRQSALRQGIDPDIAVRVARSEGGLSDLVRQSDVYKNGVREQSYGPFQLYLGGGLGNRALKAGIDPRNPEHGWKAIDFALAEAKNRGWGQWYGAAKAGIGDWQGIGGRGGGVYPEAGQAIALNDPTAQAAAGTAAASDTVATQAAETAGQMATAENAAGGDAMSKYFLMQQLFAQPQVQTPAPAPMVRQEPQQPVDPFAQVAATSQTPGFYRRRYYG